MRSLRQRPRTAHFSTSLTLALCAGLVAGCARPESGVRPEDGAVTEVTLHPDELHQVIHNFGASDAWSIQFVGLNWPEEKRERIADLLFSRETHPDGSPIGIGLSAWRFNLGAGSAGQGSDSGIRDPWRRAGSFLGGDGSFDPDAHPGQRAFLRLARQRGVEQFYAFSNSPPVALTRNGRAHSDGGDRANLGVERHDDFAEYLARALAHLQAADGIEFEYVSPFNEPQWDWTGGQEGSPWRNEEIASVTRHLSRALIEAGLSTRIEIPETARYNYLYEEADKPGRGAQAVAFFDPGSPHYVGELRNVARRVAAHSYFTTFPEDTLRAVRQQVRAALEAVDPSLELLTTEYCILENHERIRGQGRDLGIDAALYMAGVIHADLVDAGSTGWQWWLAVSPYDYKDGLVYIDRDTLDGAVYESKMLWTLGHYSRFVRPGMRRIGVEAADSATVNGTGAPLLVSAYREPESGRLAVVLMNRGEEDRTVRLRGARNAEFRAYRTTASEGVNLRFDGRVRSGAGVALPARSLLTLVGGAGEL